MPTYLSPGVYVEEVDRGSKPIEGVGTAVAAFVGFTARGPSDDPADPEGIRPRLVTNWAQFETLYGGFVEGALLPHAVYGYFNNGGGACYITRIPHTKGGGAAPRAALSSGAKRQVETLEVRALDEGTTDVEVAIEPAEGEAPTSFTMRVFAGGQEVETFPDLTFGRGNRNVETVLNQESRYVRVSASVEATSVAPASRSAWVLSSRRPGGPQRPTTMRRSGNAARSRFTRYRVFDTGLGGRSARQMTDTPCARTSDTNSDASIRVVPRSTMTGRSSTTAASMVSASSSAMPLVA